VGLFGGSTDRGEVLALENRVARLEEQVARLTAALAAAAPSAEPTPVDPSDPGGPVLPVPDHGEARALAAAGRRIEAIKVVREESGMSLRAAKDLVESWRPGGFSR
jgi:large subunit ribosomal protein L7/L12